jgi:hypothetical protein
MTSEPRTLLLSPNWFPHDVVSWQQSVTLLYQEKADAIESYEATVSSPSVTIKIPAVMRLHELQAMHKGA